MSKQSKHFFTVTLETKEPVTREAAKASLLDLLAHGRRNDDGPEIRAVGEKPDA